MNVKCRRCRKHLFNGESVQLITAHFRVKQNANDADCGANELECCSYVSEEKMPESIEFVVNQESWTKGRIHCPHCNNRVGSFNFVTQLKCNCGQFVTPPIRIINSKVDIMFPDQ